MLLVGTSLGLLHAGFSAVQCHSFDVDLNYSKRVGDATVLPLDIVVETLVWLILFMILLVWQSKFLNISLDHELKYT